MLKRFYSVFLLLIALCGSREAIAQDNISDNYIETVPDADVYPVPKERFFGSFHRTAFDYCAAIKPKKLSVTEQAKVIGFTNRFNSLSYDTYLVLIQGKRYYIYKDQVINNNIINKQNKLLQEEYNSLKASVDDNESVHIKAYNDILQKIDDIIADKQKRIKEIDNNADALEFEYIKDLASKDIARARSNAEKYRNWVKTLPREVQPTADKIAIVDHHLEGNSDSPLNYSLSFVNWSSKTIKNLYWVGRAKNAFGEYVNCLAKKTGTFSNRFSGPVAPFTREYAHWEGVLYNKEASTIELTSLKIEYADGSSLLADSQALKYITNVPQDVIDRNNLGIQSIYEGLSDEDLKAPWVFELSRLDFKEQLNQEKQNLTSSIDEWQDIKAFIQQEGLWSSEVDHMGIGTSNSQRFEQILPELQIYGITRRNKKELEDALTKFKRKNLLQ